MSGPLGFSPVRLESEAVRKSSSFPCLRGRGATATTEATTERRLEASGRTALLALTSVPAAVTALTVTPLAATATTAAERPALALALGAHHAAGRSVGSLLLDVGGGNDLSGKVQPLAEVVETLGGEGVVIVLPREAGLHVAARVERLAGLDDIEVLGVDIGVLGKVEVLRGDEHALTEEVLFVDTMSVPNALLETFRAVPR